MWGIAILLNNKNTPLTGGARAKTGEGRLCAFFRGAFETSKVFFSAGKGGRFFRYKILEFDSRIFFQNK